MRLVSVFLIIYAFSQNAAATDPTCEKCLNDRTHQTSNADVMNWMSDVITPLEEEYFDPDAFEQDETGTQIALTSTEVKPPRKRRIWAYRVRANSLGKIKTDPIEPGSFADVTGFNTVVFSDGTMYLENIAARRFNLNNGTQNPEASLIEFSQFTGKTFDESVNLMRGMLPQPYTDDQVRLAAAYLNFSSSTNPAQMQETLKKLGNSLNTSEKIRLVQMIGSESARRYDYDRAKLGLKGGAIDPYEVLMNLKNPAKKKLGICRDIAPAQTRALYDHLGFKNVYSIAYNAGSNHVAIVMQDPDDPKKALLMSYDDVEKRDLNLGTGALSFSEDYSQNYLIQDAHGKTVANLPSELSKIIKDGGGANVRRIDPMNFRSTGSVASLSLEGEKAKYSVFTGQTSQDLVVGVAQTYRTGNEEGKFYLTTTSAITRQTRNLPLYTNKSVTGEAYAFSTMVSTDVNTGYKTLSNNSTGKVEIRGVTRTTLNADITSAGVVGDKKELGTTPTLNSEAGVEIKKTGATQDNASWKIRAASQFGLGTGNISGQKLDRVYHNVSYVSASGENINLPKGLKGSFDAAVAVREFGPEIFTQAKVTNPDKKWSMSAGYQGSLGDFSFMPDEAFAEFEKELRNGMKVNASYIQPIGFAPQVQLGLKGTIPSSKRNRKPAVISW